jgi:hypothetical protein
MVQGRKTNATNEKTINADATGLRRPMSLLLFSSGSMKSRVDCSPHQLEYGHPALGVLKDGHDRVSLNFDFRMTAPNAQQSTFGGLATKGTYDLLPLSHRPELTVSLPHLTVSSPEIIAVLEDL